MSTKYEDGSELVKRELPCPNCPSSDACCLYDDGHAYCFSCNTHIRKVTKDHLSLWAGYLDDIEEEVVLAHLNDSGLTPEEMAIFESIDLNEGEAYVPEPRDETSGNFVPVGAVVDIPARKLKQETCEFYNYTVSQTSNGDRVHLANYMVNGAVVAQKVRNQHKNFMITGEIPGLYGEGLFQAGRGDILAITEGEIDALSLFQALRKSKSSYRPVVSVPNGAAGAKKAIMKSFDFVTAHKEVVLMFDQDEQGRKAAQEVAEVLFGSCEVKIATLPRKDANAMLQDGLEEELRQAYWNAPLYMPNNVVAASSLWEELQNEKEELGFPLPWPALTEKTGGFRRGEIITITSGTGMGKSTFMREIAQHFLEQGLRVGMIVLEEKHTLTLRSIMGIKLSKNLLLDKTAASLEEQKEAFDAISPGLFFYKHCGDMGTDHLIKAVRYLGAGLECDFIILDHLTMAVGAAMSEGEGDERRRIDGACTALAKLVSSSEFNSGLIMATHLSRQDGKPHEEGGQVSLKHIRGSHGIPHVCHTVIALERNQQCETSPNRVYLRVLKTRHAAGAPGLAGSLLYRKNEGRLRCWDTFEGFDPGEKEEPADPDTQHFKPRGKSDAPVRERNTDF